jgi:hypothetical protein
MEREEAAWLCHEMYSWMMQLSDSWLREAKSEENPMWEVKRLWPGWRDHFSVQNLCFSCEECDVDCIYCFMLPTWNIFNYGNAGRACVINALSPFELANVALIRGDYKAFRIFAEIIAYEAYQVYLEA